MGMREDVRRWYLVYAKPRQEPVAQENLVRQGFEIYLPLIRQPRKRSGKRVTIIAPMFPRYLFIHLDSHNDNWGPIRSTLGVASLVRFGQTPAQVPDDLITAIRSREDEHGIHVMPADEYKPGGRVRITEGSFMGYEGIFLAKTGHDRVLILLDILGRHTRASVDAAAIEPAR
jgi:transcriptional antiterminator RfaH